MQRKHSPKTKAREDPWFGLFGLKSGIQFSMTSKITRQMIHQARNSAGVLLHARQRTIHGLFQAVTFSVWQEQKEDQALRFPPMGASHIILVHYTQKIFIKHSFCTLK